MTFDLKQAFAILERTPEVLRALLQDLPQNWTSSNEGENTWSPYDVVGHLIHGEKTDWMERARIILNSGMDRAFEAFDRFAQFENSKGKSLDQLLEEFANLRQRNLADLRALRISEEQLDLQGRHPELGTVTLRQLLATWTVHDLGHLVQISRVMAKQYREEVGPWKAYLGVL